MSSSTSCLIMFCMSSTAMGSTPAKGSSSSKNLGSPTKALAISTRLRSPPLKRIPKRLRIGSMLKISKSFSIRGPITFWGIFNASAAIIKFSSAVRSLNMLDSCGKYPMPSLALALSANFVTSSPSKKTCPSVASVRPHTM